MKAAILASCLILSTYLSEISGKAPAGTKVHKTNTRGKESFSSSSKSKKTTTKTFEDKINDLGDYHFRNASHEERLLMYLFQGYDPTARAVMDTDKPVRVVIDFVLLRIHGLEEKNQVLTTTGLIIAEWQDERLGWDPESFGNLKDIILKSEGLWLPELAIMNGAEELVPNFDRIRILLDYKGHLHWEPGGIFKTTCDIDITYFPFDLQHCQIVIGAYSYYSNKMNITNASSSISTFGFQENGEWLVHGTAANWNITVLDCCPGNGYAHVVFTLHLKRRYRFYLMNIVLPCVMLSTLIMLGFFLPPECGEKISLGISVLLAFTVFLLMIADMIPRTSLAIPLIVVYLMSTMTLGTISICMTVFVLNLHHRNPRGRMPPWIRKLLLVHVAKIVCVTTTYQKSQRPDHLWRRRSSYEAAPASKQPPPFHINGINSVPTDSTVVRLTSSQAQNNSKIVNHQNGWKAKLPSSLSRELICRQRKAFGSGSTERHSKVPDSNDVKEEWKDLVRVLDRLFFWFICILMTSTTILILLYPSYCGTDNS